MLISAALGGEALRFDERLRVVEATGRYEQLPKDRLFLDYLSFDPETSLFQLVSLGPDPSTNRMAPSADGKRFFRTSMFYSNSLAMPLELRETWTLVGDDRIEIRAEIGGVFAEYEETYAADLVRRNEAPDDCLTP